MDLAFGLNEGQNSVLVQQFHIGSGERTRVDKQATVSAMSTTEVSTRKPLRNNGNNVRNGDSNIELILLMKNTSKLHDSDYVAQADLISRVRSTHGERRSLTH